MIICRKPLKTLSRPRKRRKVLLMVAMKLGSPETDCSCSLKHRSDERDDNVERHSRSGDYSRYCDQNRERGSSHQRSWSRDGERYQHRSSWEHKDKERDGDRDRIGRRGRGRREKGIGTEPDRD